jgi:hypothetical protein
MVVPDNDSSRPAGASIRLDSAGDLSSLLTFFRSGDAAGIVGFLQVTQPTVRLERTLAKVRMTCLASSR